MFARMSDLDDRMPRSRERLDRALSLAAGIAALTAVAVSLYQTDLARRQLRASAWPYVTQSNAWVVGEPYRRSVANQGVGPARVRSFQVLVDGRPVATWNDAVRALTGAGEPGLVYSSFGRGSVLPAGKEQVLLTLPAGERAGTFWEAAQTRLETVACYCSVYDECWRADTREAEPVMVPACESRGDGEFRQ
jgi:hypothetical protein